MDSTTWYNQNTATLLNSYDALDVGQVHEWATRHLREEPGFACDIGAGSGRDANWLAEQGWEVVAVEPSNMRELAQRNTHQRVTWLDDSLPGLKALRELGRKFDLILLSAVWMHVAPATRERAFRILVELLNPAGVLVITLRQGTDENEKKESVASMSRIGEIEELGEFIAESYFPNHRVEPEALADINGVSYNYGNYGDAFDGLLECMDGEFHIYGNIDRLRSPEHARARFTFGHELGHYYIDDHRNALAAGTDPHASFTDYQSKNPAEQEADAFAAALLMPMRRFQSEAKRRAPGVETIRELVDLFGTSFASTSIRYAKSNTHPVIVMRWTKEGRRWCWSSDDMEKLTRHGVHRRVAQLPTGSLTESALAGTLVANEPQGSTLSAWSNYVPPGSRADVIVVEELLPVGEFGYLTILYPE